MIRETLQRVLNAEADALKVISENLTTSYEDAVESIESCKGRVICCGVGKSGHVARKTAGTLASTGTPSLFLHASEAVHGDLGMVTENDVVLVYSYSGETDEIVRLFPSFKDIGAKTIAITGRENSSAAKLSDIVVNVFVKEELRVEWRDIFLDK